MISHVLLAPRIPAVLATSKASPLGPFRDLRMSISWGVALRTAWALALLSVMILFSVEIIFNLLQNGCSARPGDLLRNDAHLQCHDPWVSKKRRGRAILLMSHPWPPGASEFSNPLRY